MLRFHESYRYDGPFMSTFSRISQHWRQIPAPRPASPDRVLPLLGLLPNQVGLEFTRPGADIPAPRSAPLDSSIFPGSIWVKVPFVVPIPFLLSPFPFPLSPFPFLLSPFPFPLCPFPFAPCPLPSVLSPSPFALCRTCAASTPLSVLCRSPYCDFESLSLFLGSREIRTDDPRFSRA